MKKHVFLGLFCAVSFVMLAQEATDIPTQIDTVIYKEFDIPPIFAGCESIDRNTHERLVCSSELLHNYIYDNLLYPGIAKQAKTQGIVVVNFVIEPDGSISNCKAVNFISPECNQEAMRLARSMPAWLPAEVKGTKLRSEASIAVRFKLLQDGTVYRPPFVAPKKSPPSAPPIVEEKKKLEQPIIGKQKSIEGEIFKVVETLPFFPGCEDVPIEKATKKKRCSDEFMIDFIYTRLEYPEDAKASNIEGTVYIKFIVEKDGNIANIEVVRDIGGGCGAEAVRVVSEMPDWEPARQNGKIVNVQFNLPVKFKL
jgi:TonB family protein